MAEAYVKTLNSSTQSIWGGAGPALPFLTLELTERCNNACQHCFINQPLEDLQARQRELSTEAWKGIIQQAADLGVLQIRLTGGEPLVRDDFAELYLFARRKGMSVLLFTNARLITPELAQLFARIPPREKIEVTVYGMRAESYDAVACSPGAFAEFRRGIDLLLEYRVPFIVKGAMLPENEGEIEEFRAWAATLPWMDAPPAYAMYFDLRGRRDSEARNRLIRRLRVSPEMGLRIETSYRAGQYHQDSIQLCGRAEGAPAEALFICGAGNELTVDAYGVCQPCLLMRAPEFTCDLRSGTLKEAFEQFFPRVLARKTQNTAYLERCGQCFIRGICEQCPAKAWMEHGEFDTPVEYLCAVAHEQARYLGLLEAGEKSWQVSDGSLRVARLQKSEENG